MQLSPSTASATGTPPTRSAFSRRLFTYVLSDFLIVLLICVLSFQILFLFSTLMDDLNDFVQANSPTSQIVRYFMLLQPQYLVRVLPMSTLVASTWVIVKLCRHNELTAMRASGISLLQIAQPILVAAVALTVTQFVVAEWAAPAAAHEAKRLRRLLTHPESPLLPDVRAHLAYRNRAEGRDWLFHEFDPDGQSSGVLVTQFLPDGLIDWELRAAAATYADGAWTFQDAMFTRFDKNGEFGVKPATHITSLTSPDAELGLPALSENPTRLSYLFQLRAVDTLAVPALWRILNESGGVVTPSSRAILQTHLVYRLAFPMSCLLAVLIGVPMAVSNEREAGVKSILMALGMMVVFYIFAEIFLVLGKAQVIHPYIAGGLPALGFTGLGAWNFYRKL